MALTKLTADVNNIQTLADQPTESATIIKQKFDKAGSDIKTYINDTLTVEIDTNLATKQEVQDIYAGGIADGSIADAKLSSVAGNIKPSYTAHAANTTTAHGGVDAASILTKLKTVDGIGSGLDAETVGGKSTADLKPYVIVGSISALSIEGSYSTAGVNKTLNIPLGRSGLTRLKVTLGYQNYANNIQAIITTSSTSYLTRDKSEYFRPAIYSDIVNTCPYLIAAGIHLAKCYISGSNLVLLAETANNASIPATGNLLHYVIEDIS